MESRNNGMTFSELLAAIAVITVIAVVFFFPWCPARSKAKDAAARADIYRLSEACAAYHADHGTYPPDDCGGSTQPLVNALSKPGPKGCPYMEFKSHRLRNGEFISPLGNRYYYRENRSKAAKTPDMRNPDSFDIWTQNAVKPKAPDGINNWGD